MTIPSRVQGSGTSPLATQSICGTASTGLTATGTTAAGALQLETSFNVVSTTTANLQGVKLLKTENGACMVVANNAATNTIVVYPPTGSTIDGAASVQIATTKRRVFWGTSDTTWVSLIGA